MSPQAPPPAFARLSWATAILRSARSSRRDSATAFRVLVVEVRAALEYNFDLHVEGNHAPFVFVAHTHVYVSSYDDNAAGTADQRRVAIEDFLAYALAKTETRMVPLRDVVEWMRHPQTLTGQGPSSAEVGQAAAAAPPRPAAAALHLGGAAARKAAPMARAPTRVAAVVRRRRGWAHATEAWRLLVSQSSPWARGASGHRSDRHTWHTDSAVTALP